MQAALPSLSAVAPAAACEAPLMPPSRAVTGCAAALRGTDGATAMAGPIRRVGGWVVAAERGASWSLLLQAPALLPTPNANDLLVRFEMASSQSARGGRSGGQLHEGDSGGSEAYQGISRLQWPVDAETILLTHILFELAYIFPGCRNNARAQATGPGIRMAWHMPSFTSNRS